MRAGHIAPLAIFGLSTLGDRAVLSECQLFNVHVVESLGHLG